MSTEDKDQKTFAELLHDPENLPTDPDALAALIGEVKEPPATDPADTDDLPKGDEPKGDEPKGDAPKDEKKDEPKGDEPKADAPKDDPKGDAKGEEKLPVELPGGKTIPYEVLASTRRREDAERRAREAAEARVKELTEEVERAKQGKEKDPQSDVKTNALKEKIDALKAEVPEVGALFDEVLGTIDNLSKTVEELRGQRDDDAAREKASAATRVQAAIDGNPVLRYWQNEKPDLFDEAAGYDRQMRENPKLAHLTMEQRFERVVTVMEGVYGPTELPEGYKPTGAPAAKQQAKDDPNPKGSGKDAKAGTEAKIEDRPLTLSDLPGGAPPKNDQKAMEDMTAGDVEASVNRMLDKGMSPMDIIASMSR